MQSLTEVGELNLYAVTVAAVFARLIGSERNEQAAEQAIVLAELLVRTHQQHYAAKEGARKKGNPGG